MKYVEFLQSPSKVRKSIAGAFAAGILLTACSPETSEAPLDTTSIHSTIERASNPAVAKAAEITAYLQSPDFTKGYGIPVLNGDVILNSTEATISARQTVFENPLLLVNSGQSNLDGSWIGVPAHNPDGRIIIEPLQLNIGTDANQNSMSINLNETQPIFQEAAIYTTEVTNAPDQLIAYDRTGNNQFPSTTIDVVVEK